MYQDLSYMTVPLPEDVTKLKNYGDFAGAMKMVDHFLSKDIPQGTTAVSASVRQRRPWRICSGIKHK